jgi:phytoene dehydrogenase-like protein
MVPLIHRFGLGYAVGGSKSLTDATISALTSARGTVRTDAPVAEFTFAGDRVSGVRLASGEVIEASRAVVAALNIKQLPGMTGHRFGPDWDRAVARLKPASFSLLVGHLALSEAPEFKAGPAVTGAGFQEVALPLAELRQQFDRLKYGEPIYAIPSLGVASAWDPSRAPGNQHTLYLLAYAPRELAVGDWNQRKDHIFDAIFDTFCGLTTNMSRDKVLSRVVHSPLDTERFNASWQSGDPGHLGSQLFQFMGYRPLPNMGYRLPAEGFYLVGPSTHPGPGVTGGGRAGAQAIMRDLGINFSDVIRPHLATAGRSD